MRVMEAIAYVKPTAITEMLIKEPVTWTWSAFGAAGGAGLVGGGVVGAVAGIPLTAGSALAGSVVGTIAGATAYAAAAAYQALAGS
jgi:hypothetical protein